MINEIWLILTAVFILACGLVWAILKLALKSNSLMDEPNLRSSHTMATPRGGGIAIAAAFLFGISVYYFAIGNLSPNFYLAVCGAAALITVVGFCDDVRSVSAKLRLLVQGISAIWVMYWLKGLPQLQLIGEWGMPVELGFVLGTVGIIWLINLYNFMDGIDGIASFEAISVSLACAFLYYLIGETEHIAKPLLLACAVTGFAVWNFPRAKIFMGDSGSGFLGLLMAVLAIDAGWLNPDLFWAWFIMLGVFIVDASFTLARRMLQRQVLYEAHRSHAYQIAAQRVGAHPPVTLVVVLINILWLFPLAICVVMNYLDERIGILAAYFPMILIAWYLGAGSRISNVIDRGWRKGGNH